ncbi:MAG: transposase [Tannerella sp.]|nr:transposase [Tannerella sp.]
MTKELELKESRKRNYDLRMISNAIFYLLKIGCQWRMHPK